ncbi:hypothetical protein MSAN_02300200 [Mycena sanguinolenta]|uniref:Uncharacterized protein n=1 Tax=Mycena sanguinolenta TaxID=230812 RepID=A0A8H7CGG5_9AGAR|nr:hypothetical protein MSAN_02300200 [Mycena sanguinolenta]
MVSFSIIFAASFSTLVAAQALLDQIQLPTSDPQCPVCSPTLASDFAAGSATTECSTTDYANAFFNCLVCSSQTGSLSPQGLGLSDIQDVADDFMQRCQRNGFSIQVNIGSDGSVSEPTGDSSSSGESSSSSGDSDSPDSSPSSTDSPASPTPTGATTTKKSGGQRVTSRAGIVLSITLGMACFALI